MQSLQLPKGNMITINIVPGLANDYVVTSDEIAPDEGAFGRVYKAKSISSPQTEVCIKTSTFAPLDPSNRVGSKPIDLLVDGLATIETIKKHPHQNIVKYYFAGIDIETKKLYEVMEYCNNKTVYNHNNFTLDESLKVCYQIASALEHLHSFDIVHRDVKSDNIFVHQDQQGNKTYKLADFGLSCLKRNIKTQCGNKLFKAPEFFDGQFGLSNKIDIWGLGVIFYNLLFNEFPFDDPDDNDLAIIKKIVKGVEYPHQKAQNLNLPQSVQQLIEGMLEKNPTKRFSAKNIMLKINEIRNMRSINYTSLALPTLLSGLQMKGSICLSERGIVKSSNQYFFTIDECGHLCKINPTNNSIQFKQKFDTGNSNNSTSVIINQIGNCLIVSGCDNKNMYALDPVTMKTKREWKQTHVDDLNRVVFLDNTLFCAGYDDGYLKKYSVDSAYELANFQICESYICSFYADINSKELLVGDSTGMLYSVNWDSFMMADWEIKVHQNWIHSIYKSESLIVTGSSDNSIALINSSNPPQLIKKFLVGSEVRQVQLSAGCSNILILCHTRCFLYKIDNEELQELAQIRNDKFKNRMLKSFAWLDDYNVIIGDESGNLFSMKLLK